MKFNVGVVTPTFLYFYLMRLILYLGISFCSLIFSYCQITESFFDEVISDGTNQQRFRTIKKFLLSKPEEGLVFEKEKIDWFGIYKNILVKIPGQIDTAIYVTCHYDKVDANILSYVNLLINGSLDYLLAPTYFTSGKYDNGTGVAVSLALLDNLLGQQNKYSYVFLFTGLEEYGSRGARTHVSRLKLEEYSKIKYVINIDMIGSKENTNLIGVSADVSDEILLNHVRDITAGSNLSLYEEEIKKTAGSSDFDAFQGTTFGKDFIRSFEMNFVGALFPQKSYFTKKKHALKLISFSDKFKFGFSDFISIISPVSFGRIHSFRDKRSRLSLEHLNNYHKTIYQLIKKIEE